MIAWVLAGGGARIVQSLHLIRDLPKPQLIVGSSAGALLGALYSRLGFEGAKDEILRIKKRADVFTGHPFFGPFRLGLWHAKPMRRRLLGIMNMPGHIPTFAVSYNMRRHEICHIDVTEPSERSVRAVVASSAIPILVDPVEIDKMLLVDGGLTENTPLDFPITRGASEIHVVSCSAADEQLVFPTPRGKIDMALKCVEAMRRDVAMHDVRVCLQKNSDPRYRKIDVRFHSPKVNMLGVLDFSAMQRVWARLESTANDAKEDA